MNSLKIALNEIKILTKSRFVRLALFVVTLIPLLYGVLYLWAFWDPYKNMKDVPIAVVNNDQGATKDSTKYNFGDQIVDKLKANDNFKWEFVSQSDADNGLGDKKYYVELIIPNDFSEDIISVDSGNPKQGVLEFKAREATNLLASQISNSAAKQLSATIGNEISKNYFDNIFIQTKQLADGMQKAADGSNELTAGLASAESGSLKLTDGTTSAYAGSEALVSGINQLLLGDNTLNSGLSQSLTGAQTLNSGISQAATGAKSLTAGSAQVKSGISQVNDGVNGTEGLATALQTAQLFVDAQNKPNDLFSISESNSLYPLLKNYNGKATNLIVATAVANSKFGGMTPAQAENAIISSIVAPDSTGLSKLAQLQAGLAALSTGDSQLDSGINGLSTALNSQIAPGSSQLVSGLSQLNSGSKTLNSGLASAQSGSQSLTSGLSQLSSGSKDLSSGITTAATGAAALSQGLSDGAKQASEASDSSKTSKMSPAMSDPVQLSDISIDKVPNYGTGFAPYFIPLALWVGSLILFLIIKTNETSFKNKASKLQVNFSKYLTSITLGTLQALVMDTVLIYVLHLSPVHPVLFYLFTILVSWCFIAILQFLVSIFADAGKFIGIVLLMLQLTSAAGTFPLETAPKFFKIINPYLPMTYVVSGLREVISGNNMHLFGIYALVIAICAIVFLILTLIFNRKIYLVDDKVITNENELVSATQI